MHATTGPGERKSGSKTACMVRGLLGAHIASTAVVACVLICCMRGGRAFTACCARSCSRNNLLPAAAAFAQRGNCSPLGVGDTLRANQSNVRLLSGLPAGARRRKTRHRKLLMSTSSSSPGYSSVASCPVKRHRNTFLLPLQQGQQHHQPEQGRRQEGEAPRSAAPTHSRRNNIGEDQAAAAAAPLPAAQARAGDDDSDDAPLALVVLNAQGDGESKSLLRHLWGRAALRVCADGGANRLHDSFGGGVGDPSAERARFVPDIIVGDLDSLRPEVARFYEGLGSEIKLRDDQDHCDFEKCLVEVERRLSSASPSGTAVSPAPDGTDIENSAVEGGDGDGDGAGPGRSPPCAATVVGLGAFGGRFDHEMQAVSLLHAYTSRFHRLVLMGAGNVAFLLEPGMSHSVEPDPRFEGPTVGLIPVGGPCRTVNTEGLRWNLEGRGLEFGVCVSSSNLVVEDMVRVRTDAPLVWTAEFKSAAWIEAISSTGCD